MVNVTHKKYAIVVETQSQAEIKAFDTFELIIGASCEKWLGTDVWYQFGKHIRLAT